MRTNFYVLVVLLRVRVVRPVQVLYLYCIHKNRTGHEREYILIGIARAEYERLHPHSVGRFPDLGSSNL